MADNPYWNKFMFRITCCVLLVSAIACPVTAQTVQVFGPNGLDNDYSNTLRLEAGGASAQFNDRSEARRFELTIPVGGVNGTLGLDTIGNRATGTTLDVGVPLSPSSSVTPSINLPTDGAPTYQIQFNYNAQF
jgi:hypothetical protein